MPGRVGEKRVHASHVWKRARGSKRQPERGTRRRTPGIETGKSEEDRMSLRKLGANKRWPFVMVVAMFLSGISPSFMPQAQVNAQVVAGGAPVGNGFVIN